MNPITRKLVQIIVAIAPLLFTPLLFYALSEGLLNLGGGEKDVLWMIPWGIWGVVFLVSAILFMRKSRSTLSWLGYTLTASIALMVMLFIVTYILSVSGVI